LTLKKSRLVSDANGNAIQGALYPYSATVITFDATARKNSSAIVAEIVRVVSDQDCYVRFDGADATGASGMFIKANEWFCRYGYKFKILF
jgi:hypothetical protein